MVVVKVGRGIGAGIVIGGQLYAGEGSGAGEIGHSAIADNARPCRCGSVGCLETVASSRAVVQRARELAPHAPGVLAAADGPGRMAWTSTTSCAPSTTATTSPARSSRTRRGTSGARSAGLIGTLSIHRVVLVGEMTRFGEPWLGAVRREAHRSALAMLADATTIEIGRLGDDLVVLGAAALLMTRELGLALTR